MAVKLAIEVDDISGTLGAGYTRIKVYRSAQELGVFDEITTPTTTVPLVPSVSDYEFIDGNGTTTHWYKTTFYNPSAPAETTFSGSFQGVFYDAAFPGISYELEAVYTNEDYLVIDKIRNLIGDRKEMVRDYVLPDNSNISEDRYSYTFSNPKGWPLKVVLDDVLYATKSEPVVNGYTILTFSGSQITSSGTLDVWYYHFKLSDSEILQAYNGLVPPAPLTAEEVTFELAIVCTAIDLLIAELGVVSSTAGIEVDIFEEIRVNPKAGLDSRFNTLKILLARKKELIDEIVNSIEDDIFGVLID